MFLIVMLAQNRLETTLVQKGEAIISWVYGQIKQHVKSTVFSNYIFQSFVVNNMLTNRFITNSNCRSKSQAKLRETENSRG